MLSTLPYLDWKDESLHTVNANEEEKKFNKSSEDMKCNALRQFWIEKMTHYSKVFAVVKSIETFKQRHFLYCKQR